MPRNETDEQLSARLAVLANRVCEAIEPTLAEDPQNVVDVVAVLAELLGRTIAKTSDPRATDPETSRLEFLSSALALARNAFAVAMTERTLNQRPGRPRLGLVAKARACTCPPPEFARQEHEPSCPLAQEPR